MRRPTHFLRDPTHCAECAEHEATLSRLIPGSVRLADVGNPGWDPFCFASDDAFRYFLPGLARLALGTGRDYYFGQFAFHLASHGRIESFDPLQKGALGVFLDLVYATKGPEIEAHGDELVLLEIYDLISSGRETAP